MREILFRGRSWQEGKWVNGDLLHFQDRAVIHQIEHGCRAAYDVDHATVGQFTGLKDRNGKRIFEGDIVRARLEEGVHAGFEWPIMRVEYRDAAFTLVDKLGRAFCTIAALAPNVGLEVLGNVHDDPGLIGGADDENA